MIGALRHGSKHRAKVRALRGKFPRMVTHRFIIRPHPDMRIVEEANLLRTPAGSTIRKWAHPPGEFIEVEVTHPAHLPVVINSRFVKEIRC